MKYRAFVKDIVNRPAIVAHRGAWHHAPENSIAAIEAAIAGQYDIVEVDIQKSADGVLFLMHDWQLTRMTGNVTKAQDLTIAHLQSLPMRNGKGGEGAGLTSHHIPTLAEALETARGKLFLDLDVKSFEHLADVASLAADMGVTGEVDIKIKVQTAEQAAYLTELEKAYGLMVMPMVRFEGAHIDEQIALLQSVGANVVESKFDELALMHENADAFRKAGLTIWVNTLDSVACDDLLDSKALEDPEKIWGRMCDAGIGIVQTDEPEALAAWRGQRNG
ncbi:glycerophosphodiester phosphodiesterase family protein [uncultured Cohaesibacter sp.]|uniref:glycerophosphodiester phosphodiesterase family protein n=1 Tax=uncultured Cohaesibacter sp. TaxID=1002546 RepID=UPI002931058D|nr:glycerophosphodiester phosphodiesterase family protein [uncultured Cohaesibacter sp.]